MTIAEIFNAYGGDIIALLFAILSVAFSFLAQWRIGRVGKSITGLTQIAEDTETEVQEIQTEETAQPDALALKSEKEEEDTMKFTAEYSVSLEVTVVSKNATTVLTVKKADGTVLSGAEAVKALEEIVVAAQGV